jgi:hypothetical protein
MSAKDNYSDFKDKTEPRKWSTTNTGVTAKSGRFHQDKRKKYGEVIWDVPWSYELNFGSGPHTMPFDKMYEWAYKRRVEIARDYPDMKDIKINDARYWELYEQYVIHRFRTYQPKKGPYMKVRGEHRIETRAGKIQKSKYVEFETERSYNKVAFNFAYLVWQKIKARGTPPTFFASDAVVTTVHDLPSIIKSAVQRTKGVKLVSG